MQTALITIFSLEFAFLLIHEMDAIRRQEWLMFIILKDMTDEKAYNIFLLIHIPLYTTILLLLFSPFSYIGYYIVDGFLLIHSLVHFVFRKHPSNKLNNTLSKMIICSSGLLAFIHLLTYIIFQSHT